MKNLIKYGVLFILLVSVDLKSENSNPNVVAAFQSHKEWFQTFLKNTDQKIVLRKAILRNLQSQFPHLWEKIQNPNQDFVFGFIGVGNGGVEIAFLQDCAKARGDQSLFRTFCEDPSLQMKEAFFSTIQEQGIEDLIVNYDLHPFEDPAYIAPQVDFALASHVWYYIKNWKQVFSPENSLTKFANMVTERGGVAMIALHSNTSDRYAISSDYLATLQFAPELAGEEVIEELCRLGIPHRCEIVESRLNMQSCFEYDHFYPNEEGKQLLSFLLRAHWETLSSEIQERAKQIILSQVELNGQKQLILRDCHIWIAKD